MRVPEHRSRLRGLLATWCVTAVLGTTAVAAAQGQQCPDGDERVVRVSLTVDYDGGSVSVDPWSVEIIMDQQAAGPRRVCWVVSNLGEGHTLSFDDKDPDSGGFFPGLGRTISSPRTFSNSGNPAKAGTWRYGLTVTNSAGEVLAETDPEVIVRGSR